MIIKTGIDIIEVDRIKDSIQKHGENFLNKVFTENEIKYCESKNVQKYQSYAARFAAKEAFVKAVSDMVENKFSIEWKDIEILNYENGKPYVNFKKISNLQIDISISHINEMAVASVIIVL